MYMTISKVSNIAGYDSFYVRFGKMIKNTIITEDTLKLNGDWNVFPIRAFRKPGFCEATDTAYFGLLSNRIWFFGYHNEHVVVPIFGTAYYGDTPGLNISMASTSFFKAEDGLWLLCNFHYGSDYAYYLRRYNYFDSLGWVMDSARVIMNPYYSRWLVTEESIFEIYNDTFKIYGCYEGHTPGYTVRLSETDIFETEETWDTVGICEPFLPQFPSLLVGLLKEDQVLYNNRISCISQPDYYSGSDSFLVSYRDSGDSIHGQIISYRYISPTFKEVFLPTLSMSLNDTIVGMMLYTMIPGVGYDSVYVGVGNIDNLKFHNTGLYLINGIENCAFDRDGNFYFSYFIKEPEAQMLPYIKCFIPDTGSSIYDVVLPNNKQINAFPNPFNSSVRISVGAIHELPVQIEIYDIAGKLVFTPCGADAPLSPLSRGTDTNAKHEGQGVFIWRPAPSIPSGVYLVKAKIGNETAIKRVVYLK
jgi:hypothetical protein